jgi:hypothetical protein
MEFSFLFLQLEQLLNQDFTEIKLDIQTAVNCANKSLDFAAI